VADGAPDGSSAICLLTHAAYFVTVESLGPVLGQHNIHFHRQRLTSLADPLLCRLLHRTRQPRERALLTGSTVGWEASLFGLPFIEALYGSQGVLAAAGAILVSVLAGEMHRAAGLACFFTAPVLTLCALSV
jgi:hypothetical protein